MFSRMGFTDKTDKASFQLVILFVVSSGPDSRVGRV